MLKNISHKSKAWSYGEAAKVDFRNLTLPESSMISSLVIYRCARFNQWYNFPEIYFLSFQYLPLYILTFFFFFFPQIIKSSNLDLVR